MARRDRTPRHKSHNQKKNKNPKLSPFQRELKRSKLANQAPTLKSMGTNHDIPKSERLVFEYLQARRAKQEEKRRLLMEQRAEAAGRAGGDEETEAHDTTHATDAGPRTRQHKQRGVGRGGDGESIPTRDSSNGAEENGSGHHDEMGEARRRPADTTAAGPAAKRARVEASAVSATASTSSSDTAAAEGLSRKQRKASGLASIPSLNTELRAEVGRPVLAFKARESAAGEVDGADRPRTVEEIIARKKERKHQRKSEARRQRVTANLAAMEKELEDLVKSTGKRQKRALKGGESQEAFNATFERKLREMQAERQREDERVKKLRKKLAAEGHDEATIAMRIHGEAQRVTKKAGTRGARALENGAEALAADSRDRDGTATTTASSSAEPVDTRGSDARKSISFGEDVEPVEHHVMRFPGDRAGRGDGGKEAKKRPQDFYELVDVVRYGERVEAPPVFDLIPNRNAAVSRLASKLEREQQQSLAAAKRSGNSGPRERPGLVGLQPATSFASTLTHKRSGQSSGAAGASRSAADERYRLLSSVGGMGEQKRLARLGLAPAITAPMDLSSGSGLPAPAASKQKEMELLRDRVMATYRQNKRNVVEQRKGVDLKHQFPKFS